MASVLKPKKRDASLVLSLDRHCWEHFTLWSEGSALDWSDVFPTSSVCVANVRVWMFGECKQNDYPHFLHFRESFKYSYHPTYWSAEAHSTQSFHTVKLRAPRTLTCTQTCLNSHCKLRGKVQFQKHHKAGGPHLLIWIRVVVESDPAVICDFREVFIVKLLQADVVGWPANTRETVYSVHVGKQNTHFCRMLA